MTLQKLNELGYETLLHPAYSPGLSQTEDHFFKQLNNISQEKVFNNKEIAQNDFKEFINNSTSEVYDGINIQF